MEKFLSEFKITSDHLPSLKYGDREYTPKRIQCIPTDELVHRKFGEEVSLAVLVRTFIQQASPLFERVVRSGGLIIPNSITITHEGLVFEFFEVVK